MNQDRTRQAPPLEPGTPDEQFEQLRRRFHGRLRKEQRQLMVLTKALGSLNTPSASILLDIRAFAHRLRGAALVFEFQQLAHRAKAVEVAATAASLDAAGRPCDPSVVCTMQALAVSLAGEIRTGAGTIGART